LQAAETARERLYGTLAEDERQRAARFHFARDRDRFIAARGFLRDVLGRYLRVAPAELRFVYSPYGKPALGAEFDQRLRFNLSHAHKLALCAVTLERAIGVDVEHIRPEFADEDVARRFFSAPEVARLSALPREQYAGAFFNCWTRKEAYIKARGEGLSMPLDRFEVSLVPGEPAALRNTFDDPAEAARWSLQALAPGPGYVGAVAAAGQGWGISRWAWQASGQVG
jgi:4'-phosphopantetheinyl transferase